MLPDQVPKVWGGQEVSVGWEDLEVMTQEMGQGGGESSTGAKETSRASRRSIGPARLPFPPGSLAAQPALEARLLPSAFGARVDV